MARHRSHKRRYVRRVYRRGSRSHSRAAKTISLTTLGVGGGALMLASGRAAAALAPVKAEVEKVTGLTGSSLIVAAIGNRVLCAAVPRIGAIERGALRPLGLRP